MRNWIRRALFVSVIFGGVVVMFLHSEKSNVLRATRLGKP